MNLLSARTGKIINIAHRGGAVGGIPNTLESILRSLGLGVDAIEVDVQSTGDKKLVIFHDEYIVYRDKPTKVSNLLFDELRSLDLGGGAQVPLLEEVLQEFREYRSLLILDVKTDGVVPDIIEYVKKYGLNKKVIIASFDVRCLRQASKLSPDIATALVVGFSRVARNPVGLLWTVITLALPVRLALWIGASAIVCSNSRVTETLIKGAHERQIPVFVWTTSSLLDVSALRNIGVDGILNDYPEKVQRALL